MIKSRINSKICSDDYDEAYKINGSTVKAAAVTMKKGKMDVSTSYSTEAIKYAPELFYELVAAVFRSWIVHGTVSRPLLACAFMPLLKSSLKDRARLLDCTMHISGVRNPDSLPCQWLKPTAGGS